MKRLLTNFFLILCALQFFGTARVNAHTTEQTAIFTSGDHHAVHYYNFADSRDHNPVHHSNIRSFNANTGSAVGLIIENVEEEEYEVAASKKHLESNHFFTSFLSDNSAELLFRCSNNHLVFSRPPLAIYENGRCILFQVFRI